MVLGEARRPTSRLWRPAARRALLVLCLWLAAAGSAAACRIAGNSGGDPLAGTTVNWPLADGSDIITASYANLSDRYGHAVLGDGLEPTTLLVGSRTNSAACGAHITLERPHVFEDVAPRLADLTGNGMPEIITVRSHEAKGAQIAVYALHPDNHSTLSLLATTPYIGTRFRWLAPLGAADLDGDGAMEIAYVDRPHLAKTLRVWRFENGGLREVASLTGVTNHRIGERDIAGGIRACGGAPEMIVSDAVWSELLALRFGNGQITSTLLSQDTSRPAFARAMRCENPS